MGRKVVGGTVPGEYVRGKCPTPLSTKLKPILGLSSHLILKASLAGEVLNESLVEQKSWLHGIFAFPTDAFYTSVVVVVTWTGDYCEECEVGYYGDAVAGAAADACIQCPCYQPRVVNSTCNVSNDSNVSCLYCNEGYTGPLCDEWVKLCRFILTL